MIVPSALMGVTNFNYEDYTDPTAEWLVENNLAGSGGWVLGDVDPSNVFYNEEIGLGNLPADFEANGIFLNPDPQSGGYKNSLK